MSISPPEQFDDLADVKEQVVEAIDAVSRAKDPDSHPTNQDVPLRPDPRSVPVHERLQPHGQNRHLHDRPERCRCQGTPSPSASLFVTRSSILTDITQARPAPYTLSLKPNAAYLIIGGLKGLCGSLAIQLAKRGAKHIIAMARSGYSDDISQATIKSILSEGAEIQLAIGDVSNLEDVQKVFQESKVPIAGIIQGAMVLRVSSPIPSR